ncbi:hypothetical protein MD588_24905 [Photobacterium sp. SDRW27]|uniref:hypothetical protein n=1 Tax=Photobacterium obscurum TaxID=2829490 RepID=UPI002242F8A3|nr:hypothetical protein [Photobacterium obscurum]MCW8332036.1 hypothetical protein [Photobacterium obscurum]
MSHFSLFHHSITNPPGASNVSPLQQSGSTTMNGGAAEFVIDQRLYRLYEKLRAINPSVLVMVETLNIALAAEGTVITTSEELEKFIEAIEMFEKEEGLS